MVVFLIAWLYIGFTFEVCPFFWDIIDDGVLDIPYFFFYSISLFFIVNYFSLFWKESFNLNKDVLFKFFSLLWRPFSIFFTLAYAHLKRYIHFSVYFSWFKSIKTHLTLVSQIYLFCFLIWRPLFRKWSYFGYFRTNKSKWWKKK